MYWEEYTEIVTTVFNVRTFTFNRQRLRRAKPESEMILWQELKGKKLAGFKFRRQYGIGRFVVDFYCPSCKLAVEVDGKSHLGKRAAMLDKERQQFIEKFGIQFLRFTNENIHTNLESVLMTIRAFCISSTQPPILKVEGQGTPPPTPPLEGGE